MTADDTMPRSIDDYLAQLRRALEGADRAMIQDALSDAEEHLRAECAARPGESEEAVLRAIAGSYGSPEDVAAA
ncbi:MAG: HAAS signaling domain-containing protein, partial [Planctomycetota bacterium]